ncbi:hypothetical protein LOK49_LG04G03014 [Camellia lanceoleosa]|uniref:Uncharacterized protein n=1 Tax=Camellia lanceoleosa TaxID=1840588 RepID=A0ACC0I050_9ERIC|nr:hypothetical protein LOK49_LG04G03014 [Camellia lanceoleosa]
MGGRISLPPPLPLPLPLLPRPPLFIPFPAPVPPLLPFPMFPGLPPPGGPLVPLIFMLFVTKMIQDIINNRNERTLQLSMNCSSLDSSIPEIPPECMAQLQNPEEFIKSLNINVPPEDMPRVIAALNDLRHRAAAA